jgi:hypothetical protein
MKRKPLARDEDKLEREEPDLDHCATE